MTDNPTGSLTATLQELLAAPRSYFAAPHPTGSSLLHA